MKIWLDLPDTLAEKLVGQGRSLSRAALEALAIDAYRAHRVTGEEMRRLLDLASRDELDGFLKRHGVPLEYTVDDFEREARTSAALWQTRQAERVAGSGR